MLPGQLSAENFAAYPPQARHIAVDNLSLLRKLPLAFLPLLLRELIVYDWKFPAERNDLENQFRWLTALNETDIRTAMAAFAQLHLSADLEKTDWLNTPAAFSEQLTAHLWATHQIESFRTAAVDYVSAANAHAAIPAPRTHRAGIAVIGQGVAGNEYKLFRKLRPQGTWFTRVDHKNGVQTLLDAVAKRAADTPEPYGHWYIDGANAAVSAQNLTTISYGALSPARSALQVRMQKTYQATVFDPEAFRSMLARTRPEEVGLASAGDEVLNRFQLSLLTEGSGTQVFATTFVQWAAREALRRAQPTTLLARFTPRQREKPMNELLDEAQRKPELDPAGSLIDADMAAYYTWLNQQRLSGAAKATFLVWFEDHAEAVAIGPQFERGAHSDSPIDLADLAQRIT